MMNVMKTVALVREIDSNCIISHLCKEDDNTYVIFWPKPTIPFSFQRYNIFGYEAFAKVSISKDGKETITFLKRATDIEIGFLKKYMVLIDLLIEHMSPDYTGERHGCVINAANNIQIEFDFEK